MGRGASHAAAAPVAAAAVAVAATPVTADAASLKAEGDRVKYFFASGKAELAGDASGDAATNEEPVKPRAFAVRDALMLAGAPEGRIERVKPEALTGGADKARARRVGSALQ